MQTYTVKLSEEMFLHVLYYRLTKLSLDLVIFLFIELVDDLLVI